MGHIIAKLDILQYLILLTKFLRKYPTSKLTLTNSNV